MKFFIFYLTALYVAACFYFGFATTSYYVWVKYWYFSLPYFLYFIYYIKTSSVEKRIVKQMAMEEETLEKEKQAHLEKIQLEKEKESKIMEQESMEKIKMAEKEKEEYYTEKQEWKFEY